MIGRSIRSYMWLLLAPLMAALVIVGAACGSDATPVPVREEVAPTPTPVDVSCNHFRIATVHNGRRFGNRNS